MKPNLDASQGRFRAFGWPEAGSEFTLLLPKGLIFRFQAHSGQPLAEKGSGNPSIRKPSPVYTWIGNSLTAATQSASRAAVVASRNTIRRA